MAGKSYTGTPNLPATLDSTVGDGDALAYDAASATLMPQRIVQNVKNFASGKRAAGTAVQTTATTTASSTTVAAADASTFAAGHGLAIVGAGTAHGISAPVNCYCIPRTAYAGTLASMTLSAIPFTVSTSTSRLSLPTALNAGRARIQVPDGQGVRFSNQGGALPTYTGPTAFTETSTTYYLRNAPAVMTVVMSGTPTGGTYRLIDEWTGNYVDVAYNASSATLQTSLRTLPGFAQVTISESGSTPNYTHTITWTGVPGNPLLLWDGSKLTGGTPSIAITTTTAGGWTIHDTAPHAIANTGQYTIVGQGTGTHYLHPYGDRTYEYQIAALSGNGGMTAGSIACQTTTGPHELSRFTHNMIVGDVPTNARGFVIYGDGTSNKKALMVCHKYSPVKRVALQSGGFTSPEYGDIGRTVSDGTNTGILLCFDTGSRNLWVRMNGTSFGSNGATISISGGTGGGTQTGASTDAFAFIDWGNDKDDHLGISKAYDNYMWYPRLQRRCGEQVYPGQLMETGGYFYTCTNVFPLTTENLPNDRKTMDPVAFTINTTTNVITTASVTNITTATAVYLQATVALPTHTSATRLQENTAYYVRQLTTSTYTLHPTATDATNNTNVLDLISDGLGTYYVLVSPTFSSTLGAYITDDRVQWRREDQTFPVTVPSSSINDIHIANVVSVSSNNIVVDSAPSTSVTSQLLMHDDTTALLAHWNVVKGSSAKALTMYLPRGDYPIVSRKMASESRFYNTSFGGSYQYYLFRWFGPSDTTLDCIWEGEKGTRVIWQPLDGYANAPLSNETYPYLHAFSFCKPEFRNISWFYCPKGVPVCEDNGAFNYVLSFGLDVDETAGGGINNGGRIDGPKFYGGGMFGWPSLGNESWSNDESTGAVYQDFVANYGGSNHDPGWYTNGGYWERVHCYGIRSERSMMFYQDLEDGVPLHLRDCRFEGARKDGIAVRSNDFLGEGCEFIDCTKVFSREDLNGFTLRDCKMVDTDILPHNTTNWSQDVTLENLRLFNSLIGIETGNNNAVIEKVRSYQTGKYRHYSGATQLLSLKGNNQNVNDVVVDNRAADGNIYDMRSINFGGNGNSRFNKVSITWSYGDWCTFQTSGTGEKWFDNCTFYTHYGASTPCLTQHTGDSTWTRCKFEARSGSGGNPFTISSGGRTVFELCENSNTGVTFSTITGPLHLRRNDWKSGTVTVSLNGTIIEGNNFATTPSLTGTLLFTQGNRKADAVTNSATLTIGTTNDYVLDVCNVHRFTPNASNSTLGGITARADGCPQRIINVGASASLILDDDAGGSSAANRFAFAALTIAAGNEVVIAYDGTTTLWRLVSKNF